MGRSLLLAVVLACCTTCLAQAFDVGLVPRRAQPLFTTAEEPAKESANEEPMTLSAMQERSKWRKLGLEAWTGGIAARRSMYTAGVGMNFHLVNTLSLAARLDYNHDVGNARKFRPQVRGGALEVGVRFHIDFAESVAFYGTHGINVAVQLAYFQLDESRDGTTLGVVTSLGAGTTNVFGLEFGSRTWRGFFETGLRTQFFFLQNSDEDAVEGFEDDIAADFRFQWIIGRIGLRFYF